MRWSAPFSDASTITPSRPLSCCCFGGAGAAASPGALVGAAKGEHGVRWVYAWHALHGYWRGVTPALGAALGGWLGAGVGSGVPQGGPHRSRVLLEALHALEAHHQGQRRHSLVIQLGA